MEVVGISTLSLVGSLLLTGGSPSGGDLLSLAKLTTLTLKPNRTLAGGSVRGTVSLNRPAPAGGATVLLASNRQGVIVPASVVVPKGRMAVTFLVRTLKNTQPGMVRLAALRGRDLKVAYLAVDAQRIMRP